MAVSYSQLYIQLVFAVSERQNLIRNDVKDELYRYMTGVIQERDHKLIIINGMPDHIHILIGLNPKMAISDLVHDVKIASSKFINEKKWFMGKFHWQEGYGAFSYSRSHLDKVYKYIQNQERHHQKKTFKQEYLELLEKFEIEYKDKYLFDWIE